MDDGVLSAKTKVLIALAINASSGDFEGVRSLFRGAREVGASEEKILEVVELLVLFVGFRVGLGTSVEVLEG